MGEDPTKHKFMLQWKGGFFRDSPSCVSLCVIESYHDADKDAWSALKRALTYWADNTKEGREAWHYTSKDFNIGDLESYLDDEDLAVILRNHNIANLTLLSFVGEGVRDYDEVLIDLK